MEIGENKPVVRDLATQGNLHASGEPGPNAAHDIVSNTRITEVTAMLKYVPGLVGAVAAMAAFRLLTVLDFTFRMLIFLVVYVVVTVVVEKALERYGKKDS